MKAAGALAFAAIVSLTALFGADAPIARAAGLPDVEQDCFDVAMVARLMASRTIGAPVADATGLMSSEESRASFQVEQRLAGEVTPDPVHALVFAHTGLNPEIQDVLLFLRRGRGSDYVMVVFYNLVRDRSGRFVIPVPERLDLEDPSPQDLIPANYETLLKPIEYDGRGAWWLISPPDVDPPAAADYPWARIDGSVIVALKGLDVSDLVKAIDDRRCPAAR